MKLWYKLKKWWDGLFLAWWEKSDDPYTRMFGSAYDIGLFEMEDFEINRRIHYELKSRNLPAGEYLRKFNLYRKYYKSLIPD